MHYVVGDIHNELTKLNSILNQIHLTRFDELIVLGDIFDRGGTEADPVGVYFALSGIQGNADGYGAITINGLLNIFRNIMAGVVNGEKRCTHMHIILLS